MIFGYSGKSIHIPLLRISLSPISQSCFFRVPDHPAKPLAIATSPDPPKKRKEEESLTTTSNLIGQNVFKNHFFLECIA